MLEGVPVEGNAVVDAIDWDEGRAFGVGQPVSGVKFDYRAPVLEGRGEDVFHGEDQGIATSDQSATATALEEGDALEAEPELERV